MGCWSYKLNTIYFISLSMNILITGGTGFIGTRLVKELKKANHHLILLTRQQKTSKDDAITYITADLSDPSSLTAAFRDIDVVYHNAAYAADHGQKQMIYKINVTGTKVIADLCIKHQVKHLIFTSSAGVYGFPNSTTPLVETSEKHPLNPYQQSKVDAEQWLQSLSDIKVSIIRPPLVLGSGGLASEIMIQRILQNNMVYIGSGDNTVPLVHVNDVAQILRLTLEKDTKGTVFNVVSFHSTIKELMSLLCTYLHKPKPTKHVSYSLAYLSAIFYEHLSKDPSLTRFRVKTMGTTRRISADKAKELLDFRPQYTLETTVSDMVKKHVTI